jgi:VanZ family protein
LKNLIGWAVLIFLSSLVLYYSWLTEPSFKNESYLPAWLIEWTDLHGQARTAVPFFLMGFLGFLFHENRLKAFLRFVVFSFFLVLIAELGQLFLPLRFPDIMDIFYGILGGTLGFGVQGFFVMILKANEQKR